MRRSPLVSAAIYILLACLFTYFAIDNVNKNGWDIFSIILVLLATFDFGSGIRLIMIHFKLKNMQNKK
jgi:hypothetical protein